MPLLFLLLFLAVDAKEGTHLVDDFLKWSLGIMGVVFLIVLAAVVF